MPHTDERPVDPDWSGEYDTPPPPLTFATPAPPGAGGFPDVPGYKLLTELGRGGMGVVYLANQLTLGRPVALKMLVATPDGGSSLASRFRVEAEAAARLEHPNIVRVYAVGEDAGRPYLVMEWVSGGTLSARLRAAPLPPRAAAVVVAALARAADHAHRHGVVHRDLKPGNVLLDVAAGAGDDLAAAVPAGAVTPKLADFGLAKRLDADDGTLPGAILGTPSYMAPEQADGRGHAATPAVDVYALGAVLYECLTGRPPFRAATALETLDQVRRDDPVPLSRFHRTLSRDLQTICMKCLEKNPARRYPSAAALADDLDRFGRGVPVLARPVGPLGRLARWARRRPAAAALAAVCVVGSGGGVGGLVAHNARLSDEVERTRRQEAETARQKSTALDHVRQGHAALDDIFASLDNHPVGARGSAAFQTLYRDQAEVILRYYRDILRDGDESDPEVRFGRGMVSVYAGRMNQRLKQRAAAEVDFLRGRDLLAPLATAANARAAHRQEWVQCCYWLGTLYLGDGRIDDAGRWFQGAIATAVSLEAEGSTGDRDRRVAALAHSRMAYVERTRGGPAEPHAREAVARLERLVAADPDDEVNRQWAMSSLGELAYAHWAAQDWAAFDAVARRADAGRAWYATHPPRRLAGLTGRVKLAEIDRAYAYSLITRGDVPAAAARLNEGIAALEVVLHEDPTPADWQTQAAVLYRDRASIRGRHDPSFDPLPDWDHAVSLAAGELRAGYRIERAVARLDRGLPGATDELSAVAADATLSAANAAELGRAFAGAAARDASLEVKAVEAVRRAVAAGQFKDADAFRRYMADPVFAAIRTRLEVAELAGRLK